MLWENRLSFHNLLSISGGKKVEYLWEIYQNFLYEYFNIHNLKTAPYGGCNIAFLRALKSSWSSSSCRDLSPLWWAMMAR